MSLREQRAAIIARMQALVDAAQAENRGMTSDEDKTYAELEAEQKRLAEQIEALEQRQQEMAALQTNLSQLQRSPERSVGAPMLNLATRLGDSEARAVGHYLRTGDATGLRLEQRASNATDLNIGTSADGGYAVPIGLYNAIVAKRDAAALWKSIGVLPIPGIGTTVNVPVDNGTANVFVSTNEAASFDLDGPALGQQAMTLVKYTKKVQISVELLDDEDANLMSFLENYVGRALALTENSLLITAALAGGTTNALGSASAATATDIPKLVYALKGEYADNAFWIMKRVSEGAYRALSGNNWQFVPTPIAPVNTLWGYPVVWSESMPAIGTGNKSLAFGNFAYVGRREGKGLTMLRDPYSAAGTGQVNLFFYTRLVYKVLVAEAVQYGTHP